MKVRELVRTAWMEMAAHKARSAMTCLSLAIGVAAMLFTFARTSEAMRGFNEAIDLYGPGRMTVEPRKDYVSQGRSPGLNISDAREIERLIPGLYMVYPLVKRFQTRLELGALRSDQILVTGVTEQWRKRDWVYTLRGRFFNREDVAAGARVCLIIQPGGWVDKPWWARYFPEYPLDGYVARHDVVGRRVLLNDHVFTVIGVLQEPPRDKDPRWFSSSYGEQGRVLIPITTFEDYVAPPGSTPGQVDEIDVETGDVATVGRVRRQIEALLLERHGGENDVEVHDFRELLGGALTATKAEVIAILIIGIVAILASGIGIMNVTLATIFSRIREIGVRRSLGATRADIVWQFVAEAMALGLAGGVAGAALGIVSLKYIAPETDHPLHISALHVAAAIAVALATGFLFALWPAYQASRFDPIEALRYE